ncbi:hypothetical protein CC1G_15502 [Coprinopsis cinerea okayama7|uniref:Transmembrane protein n=1 Tax=Coprinopsis cinerea (strain Okayama-7 / 130 / ATCC MYA-4618 / FGSC 9003) TaxID=240176 RepID=D6RN46_COPC7|nr:hypothetical protein CC1G_15502 [Coprinopsis cinerea okayama7\|eukprot:XP_002910961.1 hypothetical protein CC1G_15502 [Coprinopsis cinerea okayama7\
MGVLIYDDRDAAITYTGTWGQAGSDREFNSTTTWTVDDGATATINFVGTGISVYGTIAGGIARRSPRSSYAIDDEDEVIFEGDPGLTVQYNQLFYQSPTLSEGEHTLTITNLATDGQLFLDVLMVEPLERPLVTTVTTTATATASAATQPVQTVTVTASAPGSLASGTAEDAQTSAVGAQSGGANTGAIAGGVIGAILFLLLLGAGFAFWKRRKNRKDVDVSDNFWIAPPPPAGKIDPFPPPKPQSPPMSQTSFGGYQSQPYNQPAYPSNPAVAPYPTPSQTAFNASTAPPSELAYYSGTADDYNTQDYNAPSQYPQNYNSGPSQWSGNNATPGPNGRVRINLND